MQGICTNILFILCGFDEPQMNTTLLETIMKHTPAGASTPTVLHYAQEVTSGRQWFDILFWHKKDFFKLEIKFVSTLMFYHHLKNTF